MDIKTLIEIGMCIVWNKDYHVKWIDEQNKFNLNVYLFKEGSCSSILVGRKNSRYCGVKMPTYSGIFQYYTFSLKELQKLYDEEIISFVFDDKE